MPDETPITSVTLDVPGSILPAAGGPQDVFFNRNRKVKVPLPLIERAEGIYMWDSHGNRYIDVSSGPIVSNIGHGVAAVGNAMARQVRQMDFAYPRVARNQPNMDLTDRVAKLAGPGFERVCFAAGGSEANEIAVKFLRQYAIANGQPARRHVITCMPSYHGGTFGALAWSGDDDIVEFLDGMIDVSPKIPAPFTYRLPENHTVESYAMSCADALRQTIRDLGADTVLAFMIEPVGGVATGCNVPHDSFFREIRKICTDSGIYLIFDEVMSGTGRTGKFLAAHHWPDALPDIAVLAKGLGSGYVPLAAMLAPAAMVDGLAEKTGFDYSHTYTSNPVCCAAGMAVLDYTTDNGLMDNAARMGDSLREKLNAMKDTSRLVGDVRGLGLLMSVEMVADRVEKTSLPAETEAADRIRIHGLRNGLIIYSRRTSGGRFGDWFIVAPPLTVTKDECDEIIERLALTLQGLEDELVSLGYLPKAP
ncbi:MAG: aspartate aminotransferase family protein [Alphaproteobacteria bacterium]|nr:aspartate aminotransferase family protein [Alphaproteobacteria bacterium]